MRALWLLWLFCFSSVCFSKDISLTPMTLMLPDEMQQVVSKESKDVCLYLFQQTGIQSDPEAFVQLKIVRVTGAPNDESQYDTWQTDMLGRQIALWRETFQLSLEDQSRILTQKPKSEKIGNYEYKTVSMSFETQEVKFLNIVYEQATYMFTLVSAINDRQVRKEQMNNLLEYLKTVQLKKMDN